MKRSEPDIAPAERAKILEMIDRALQPVEVAKNRFLIEHDESVGEGTLAAVAAASTTPLASKEELTALRDLDARFAALLTRVSAHGRDRVKQAMERRRSGLGDTLARGGTPTGALDREGIEREFESVRAATKDELRRVCAEAALVIGAIAKKFVIFARAEVERISVQDFLESQKFGLPYRPSPTVRSLKGALGGAERIATNPKCGRPRDGAATFGITL